MDDAFLMTWIVTKLDMSGGTGQKTVEDKIQAMTVASSSSTSEFLGK